MPVRSDNENDDIEARKRKKKSNNRKRLSRVRIQNDEESQDNEEQLSDNEPNDNESSSDEKLKRRLTPRKSVRRHQLKSTIYVHLFRQVNQNVQVHQEYIFCCFRLRKFICLSCV